MHIQLLLAILAIATFGAASAQEGQACLSSCGNVTITFPFGSGEGCYHSSAFLVTCDRSSGEPVPFYGDSRNNLVISNMSTSKSEVEVMALVARDCYNSSGPVGRNRSSLRLRNFRISAKNIFVAIGCDTQAYFSGRRGINRSFYGTGCISRCGRDSLITNGSCSGVGCCEVAVPQEMRSFEIELSSYANHVNITEFNPCSYGFFVVAGKFNFSTTNFRDFESVQRMPMLLDWAIGNSPCDIATEDMDSFLCKGNSGCDPDYSGPGYRCRCHEGYEGNPYVTNSCTNINECERGTHDCEDECVDTQGSYWCSCRKGYSGDGMKDGTGCTQDQSKLIKIVVVCGSFVSYNIYVLVTNRWKRLGARRRECWYFWSTRVTGGGGVTGESPSLPSEVTGFTRNDSLGGVDLHMVRLTLLLLGVDLHTVTGTSYNVTSSSSKPSHEPAALIDSTNDASMPDGDGVRVSSIAGRFNPKGGGVEDINSILYTFTSKIASLDGNKNHDEGDMHTTPVSYAKILNEDHRKVNFSPLKNQTIEDADFTLPMKSSIKSKHDYINTLFGVSLKTLKDTDDFILGCEAGNYPVWAELDSDVRTIVMDAACDLCNAFEAEIRANSRPLNLPMSLLLSSKLWKSIPMLHLMLKLQV
ncbi:serine/threonine-protein kinase, active site protein [Artemisia annua]|uniref:Serine/threonine-protein kinase, active site protein n=1 Tax=Artemisia annua TaxID=35608 RepID=A0A2U1PV62_ARTAN|nr:serine/threonine-protein kinase, active site protein [Artemisia annua]